MPDEKPQATQPVSANAAAKKTVVQRIVEKFVAKGRTGVCAMCGHANEWELGGFVPLTISETPTALQLGGNVYPLIAVYCRNCGNTHFVNLFNLGFTAEELKQLEIPLGPTSGG